MNIYITARHFKAHETLRSYAFEAINKLEQHYDGIISADLVLSFEKSKKSLKAAELLVKVQGSVLKALKKTDDFPKSIDAVVIVIERQLQRYKAKTREKQKIVIRTKREKV
ncbi:MAG: ribosome-associated translation inhibitor RaiA [Bacteriovoracaceae bacterium]|nr:ribosome-associated translation inhibitor RaiA [Bacteroidota bacterium]